MFTDSRHTHTVDHRQQRLSQRQTGSAQDLWFFGDRQPGLLPGDADPERDGAAVPEAGSLLDAESGGDSGRSGPVVGVEARWLECIPDIAHRACSGISENGFPEDRGPVSDAGSAGEGRHVDE